MIGELRATVSHWLWNQYHTRRQAKLQEAFEAAIDSDQSFLFAIRWLDEYGRMDLLERIEYRIRRSEDGGEVERLRQTRDLLIPRL